MNNTLCAAFWKHTNLRAGDRVFPCCRFKEPIIEFDGDLQQILFHPIYENLRLRSSSGAPIAGCQKCYYEESQGQVSLRQKFNSEFDVDSVELEFFEVGFDNICNLKCNGCSSEFSHKWSDSSNSKKQIYLQNTQSISHVPASLRKVLFLGGEPLMTNRHRDFLEKTHIADLEIVYNTNGTFLLDQKTIALLQQARKVHFIVSIDALGENNALVRPGSNWSAIENFLAQLDKLRFFRSIHTTLHKDNWMYIGDLARWIRSKNLHWTVNILTHPANLDIKNLSDLDKSQLRRTLEDFEVPSGDYISRHLETQ